MNLTYGMSTRNVWSAAVKIPSTFEACEGRTPIAIYGTHAGSVTLKEATDLGHKFDVVCFLDDAGSRPIKHWDSCILRRTDERVD